MGNKNKNEGFGAKGATERPLSLAEQLLSGKPMGRKPKRDAVPRLKPRPKPVFGRRDGAPEPAIVEAARRAGTVWASLVSAGAVVLLCVWVWSGYAVG